MSDLTRTDRTPSPMALNYVLIEICCACAVVAHAPPMTQQEDSMGQLALPVFAPHQVYALVIGVCVSQSGVCVWLYALI